MRWRMELLAEYLSHAVEFDRGDAALYSNAGNNQTERDHSTRDL